VNSAMLNLAHHKTLPALVVVLCILVEIYIVCITYRRLSKLMNIIRVFSFLSYPFCMVWVPALTRARA